MPDIPAQLIQSDETFASTLLIMVIDRLGPELLTGEDGPWTAATLRLEIQEAFGVTISDDNLGKLMAAIAVITTDNLFRGVPSFLFTIHGLLGDGMDWSYAEPIDVEDLAWAMVEAVLLMPPEKEDIFDAQIVAYCRSMLKREGLMSPPWVLSFAKEDAVYGDIVIYGEDILLEQANRTEDVNVYLEQQQQRLLNQISSIPHLNLDALVLQQNIQNEFNEIEKRNRWD
jgi:hypothetical protein